MISSMTGYGRAERVLNNHLAVVEITSVNNRYLEFQIRLPRNLIGLEQKIKKLLSTKIHRGKLNFSLSFEDNAQPGSRLSLNEEIADMYFKVYSDLKERYDLGGDISIDNFIGLPDLITPQNDDIELDNIWHDIEPLCLDAMNSLSDMRKEEGKNLYKDFIERLQSCKAHVDGISEIAGTNIDSYRDRLEQRINEIMGDYPVDQQRIAMEIAIIAEKIDITEELTRLRSHINNFEQTLSKGGAVGKRLTFILQEMHREANTLSSKASNYAISELVINIKDELEKLREQAMNIE